jgi:hypothetical protein
VFELLGESIPVQPQANGEAVLRLNLDPAPIFLVRKSVSYNLVAGGGECLDPSPLDQPRTKSIA